MTDVTASKRSKAVSSESVAAPQDLIDELPESVWVEILCRLPPKTVIQCKSVSKSWSTLISQPCFYAYFSSLQEQNPTILMFARTAERETEYFGFSQQQTYKPQQKYRVVAGICNDLSLQCATPMFQRCYYISNPYTKQCVALPPAPQCHQAHVHVGFLCDSNHRCKVVRILECGKEPALFKVEIFSSKTCEWTQAVVPFPQGLTYDHIRSSVGLAGIACNGTLYWLVSNGLVIALDPSKCDNSCIYSTSASAAVPADHNFHCSFISKPDVVEGLSASSSCEQCITVSRGRLRLCQFYNKPLSPILYVWDLKEDDHEVDGVGGKMVKWSLKRKIVVNNEIAKCYYWKPLALDPDDEDILYTIFYLSKQSIPRINASRCYLGKQSIQKFPSVLAIKSIAVQNPILFRMWDLYFNNIDAFPLVIPTRRLPTPVPRLDFQENSMRFREKFVSPI